MAEHHMIDEHSALYAASALSSAQRMQLTPAGDPPPQSVGYISVHLPRVDRRRTFLTPFLNLPADFDVKVLSKEERQKCRNKVLDDISSMVGWGSDDPGGQVRADNCGVRIHKAGEF
jgi:hypothetical protein